MSACISRMGEFGEHVYVEHDFSEFICDRCLVFDEERADAEVWRLRAEIDRLTQAAEYAATAFDQRDAALAKAAERDAQIAAVLALHQPTAVHQYDDVNGVFVYDDDGPIVMHRLCDGCTWDQTLESLGDCEWSEDLDGSVYWPCPTALALGVTA